METILVVEDEPALLAMVVRLLRRRGLAAEAYPAALPAVARLSDRPFHLTITDLELPDRSGLWLLERARAIRPGMPVLLMTGMPPDPGHRRRLAAADAVVYKPFTTVQLFALVRRLLDDAAGPLPPGPGPLGRPPAR